MRVLYVGSESVPFFKSGGLGETLGSLPKQVSKQKHEVSVIIPKHGFIPQKHYEDFNEIAEYYTNVGEITQRVELKKAIIDGVTFYLIDNDYYFGSRETMYGHSDEVNRFAFFTKAVLDSLKHLDFEPDIMHLNDWHTGMIPFLIKNDENYKRYNHIKTIYTIHNISYQGVFHIENYQLFKTPYDETFEFGGALNFMKTGIMTADVITTTSPTYSKEILNDYYSHRLHDLLIERQDTVYGIINGIDYEYYNPKTDKFLVENYDTQSIKSGKMANKNYLLEKFNLDKVTNKPLVSIVSELLEQKGITLITKVIEELLKNKEFTLIIQGIGEEHYVEFFKELENKYPTRVKYQNSDTKELSHLIYAGSDLLLMPSRFEPSGLSQLISLRYGTVPLVRETGGLKDTVKDYDENKDEGYGFTFEQYKSSEMMKIFEYALTVYKDEIKWNDLVKRGMKQDFGWEHSALEYIGIYQSLK